MNKTTPRSLSLVVLGVVVALFSADQLVRLLHDSPAKLQVRDGLKQLQRTPDILAISSSHGRSFHVMGEVLRERTDGKTDLIAVALEAGKVDAMEWVLHNRVKPLIIDEEGEVKSPLTHVLFGITWWDTCREELPTQTANNVATHGWTGSDYIQDFKVSGANELNRNYIRNAWRNLFSNSALVKTRFEINENFGRFTNFLRLKLRGGLPEDESAQTLDFWHNTIDYGHECYMSEMDMLALDRFVEFTKKFDLDLTIVLFPLMPDTVTESGRRDTIEPFAEKLEAYGSANGVRVVDMALGILRADEFMLDLDHVNAEGNIRWSNYALDNEMKFLFDAGMPDEGGDR